MTKQWMLAAAIVPFALTACSEEAGADKIMETAEEMTQEVADATEETINTGTTAASEMLGEAESLASLTAAVASDRRSDDAKARDQFRHPIQTIQFIGIQPSDTVVEIWPGGGWYTDILAPYIATGGGTYYAAHFDGDRDSEFIQRSLGNFREKYMSDTESYGDVQLTVLDQSRQEIAPSGTADVVVTFRNVHNFEIGGWTEAAFAAFFDALKPGGTLGVVDHRLPEEADKAMEKSSGYVKVSTVRALAEAAGFVFDGSSEVNANPNDDADHPFGVWTLPPSSRQTARDGSVPEGFDPAEFLAVGESDRMTLRFKKPVEPEGALLE